MKLNDNIFLRKFTLISISILIIGIPINTFFTCFTFFSILGFYTFCDLKKKINLYFIISLGIIIILLKLYLPSIKIQEGHNLIILNENSHTFYENILPKEVFKYVKNIYQSYYDKSTCSENDGYCWKYFNPNNEFFNSNFKNTEFAFSSNWSLFEKKYSRILYNLDIKNLKTAKIETVNNLNFNFAFPKQYDLARENIPFFLMFEITKELIGNEICWKGQTFWENNPNKYQSLFNQDYKCKEVLPNQIGKKIYSISFGPNESIERLNELYSDVYVTKNDIGLKNFLEKNELILKIKKNNYYLFSEYFIKFLVIISLTIIIFISLKKNYMLFLLSIAYPIIFFLISYYVHEDLITGFTIYTGGNDGLIYSSYANKMFYELQNLNIYEFLKGAESIFYFMPGIRYFFSINKLIFSESIYGYLLIGYLLPIVIFHILKILIGFKIAFFITSIFVLTKLFDGYAFSLLTFLEHIKEGDSEPLGILLFLFALLIFIKRINNKNFNKENLFLYFIFGLSLSFSIVIRPNYLPGSIILIISMILIMYFRNKNLLPIIFIIIGFSFLLFLPLHNIYFGNQFYFFTSGVSAYNYVSIGTWFNFFLDIITFNYENFTDKYGNVLNQLNRWIRPEQIHFMISFAVVILTIFSKNNFSIKIICVASVIQHLVCIYIIPDSRYAYLAWILTLIVNFYYFTNIYEVYLRKKLNYKN